MNIYLIHQPRRSGKTTYFVEKAVENISNTNTGTLIVCLYEDLKKELENKLEERLKEKEIEYAKRVDLKTKKVIFYNKNKESTIKIIRIEEFIKEKEELSEYMLKNKIKLKIKDIFFDEILYKDTEILLDYINKFFDTNKIEFRFTLNYCDEQQKTKSINYIKKLIDKKLIKYSEIVFTNADNKENQLKEYYEKYLDIEHFEVETKSYLLKDKKYIKEIDYEDFLKYKSSKITKNTPESTKTLSKLLGE